MATRNGIRGYSQITADLKKMKKAPATVLKRTLSDAKKRGPAWVSAEVSKVYGIKKAEINNGAGTVKVEGDAVSSLRLRYTGRVLTPTHFSMSPKAPKDGGGAYTLKATILKGQRTTLGKVKRNKMKNRAGNFRRENPQKSAHSPIMLMRTGSTYIPFQRKSTRRSDVEAIKTVSVPQMVSNEKVAPNIAKSINENLDKRLDHYMKILEK